MSEIEERLLQEIRQLHSSLEELKQELYTYKDLNKLSTRGAIAYLVRKARLLDEVHIVVSKKTQDPNKTLQEVEQLLKSME